MLFDFEFVTETKVLGLLDGDYIVSKRPLPFLSLGSTPQSNYFARVLASIVLKEEK